MLAGIDRDSEGQNTRALEDSLEVGRIVEAGSLGGVRVEEADQTVDLSDRLSVGVLGLEPSDGLIPRAGQVHHHAVLVGHAAAALAGEGGGTDVLRREGRTHHVPASVGIRLLRIGRGGQELDRWRGARITNGLHRCLERVVGGCGAAQVRKAHRTSRTELCKSLIPL